MKRWLAITALLGLVVSSVWGQGIPESKREMGEDYRWVWDTTAVANGDSVVIRFPDLDGVSDTNAIPLATGDLATTTQGKVTVWWVQMAQYEGNVDVRWRIHSPCIPAGSTTVHTNENVPFFTFGGCTIDSVVNFGITGSGRISLFASDGK